jgi:hypothetical protein
MIAVKINMDNMIRIADGNTMGMSFHIPATTDLT